MTPVAATAHQPEIEVACSGSEPEGPLTLPVKAHTDNCSVLFADVDTFEFTPTLDGRVARFMVASTSSDIDPRLVVKDPLDQVIFDASCDGGSLGAPLPRCGVAAEFDPLLAGIYTAEISEVGDDEAGFYTAQFEMLPGTDDDLTTIFPWVEFESLQWRTDMDHYDFLLVDGDTMTVELESCDDYLDPWAQIFGPDDSLVGEAFCTTPTGLPPPGGGPTDCSNEVPGSTTLCTAYTEIDITTTGVYSLAIGDYGSNEAGRYQYTVPEPGLVGLASGLVGLSLLARRRASKRSAGRARGRD